MTEETDLVKRGMQLLREIEGKSKELGAILLGLAEPVQRQVATTDKYGEPTWAYMVNVRIPDAIKLTRHLREYAVSQGFNEAAVSEMWNGGPMKEGFVQYYRKTGKKFSNWSLVWMTWVRNEKTRPSGGGSRFDRLVGKEGR
jgi:hypothetical protein